MAGSGRVVLDANAAAQRGSGREDAGRRRSGRRPSAYRSGAARARPGDAVDRREPRRNACVRRFERVSRSGERRGRSDGALAPSQVSDGRVVDTIHAPRGGGNATASLARDSASSADGEDGPGYGRRTSR